MARLSRSDKIKIYKGYKKGKIIMTLTKKYKIKREKLQYLIRLINRHGYDLLKETKDETIKRLEQENLYLKAELGYSKKLYRLFIIKATYES